MLNAEASALAEAGAAVIQFDEPCFNVYTDKVTEWGIEALERSHEGVTAIKAVHICYGYGTGVLKRWKTQNQDWSHYERHPAPAGKVDRSTRSPSNPRRAALTCR